MHNSVPQDKVWTTQEAFNAICEHLKSMKEPSRNPSGCAYRAPDGSRCAIGCLIPDGYYNEETMEGHSASCSSIRNLPCFAYVPNPFLVAMQDVHDDANWEKNEGGLSKSGWHQIVQVAQSYNLDVPAWVQGAAA